MNKETRSLAINMMYIFFLVLWLVPFKTEATGTACFYQAGVWSSYETFCPTAQHRSMYIGLFNDDKKVDLLCHDKQHNTMEIFYTQVDQEKRTMNNLTFCNGENAHLLIGDFNGDGRSDLLCAESGRKLKILYSNSQGHFNASDPWQPDHEICKEEPLNLHVGDMNGDGKTDVVCRRQVSHRGISVSLANNTGHLQYHYTSDISWCEGNDSALLIGDYNHDGLSDMLCHDKVTGHKSISLSDSASPFLLAPGNWEHETEWCVGDDNPFVIVTDTNGDGYDDLVCKDNGVFGRTKVAVNKPGEFFVSDTEHNLVFNFCLNGGRANFFVGDFNGDGQSDLLCQSFTGTRQINISHC